jgi:hypothetical protein
VQLTRAGLSNAEFTDLVQTLTNNLDALPSTWLTFKVGTAEGGLIVDVGIVDKRPSRPATRARSVQLSFFTGKKASGNVQPAIFPGEKAGFIPACGHRREKRGGDQDEKDDGDE